MSQTPRRSFRIDATRSTVRDEIDDELRFHLDARTEALIRHGHSPDDAWRIALEEYGDVAAARDELEAIDRRRIGRVAFRDMLASMLQDIRFALRGLRARPAFTATVLLTLALGMGANVAIFSIVDSTLLRPLPYTQPDRLVHLWETYRGSAANRSEASYPDYLDWKARTRAFAGLAGYHGGGFLLGGDQPATIGGAKTTANFFDVLGVHPYLGRTFVPGEDAVGAPKVALLSYGFWQRQYNGDRAIVGRTIVLNGAPATIIGVLPRSFTFARQSAADVWTPIDRGAAQREQRGNHWLNVVARLAPTATMTTASRDLSVVMHDLEREYPRSNSARDGQVVPLRDELVGSVKPILFLLYGAVIVVLVVACVNVATFLLIRSADRQREIAVRIALGAGRGRIIRQLLTESVLLSVGGGALGIAFSIFGARGLLSLLPKQPMRGIPPITSVGVDVRIALYAFALAVIAGLAFGLAPIPALLRSRLHDALKSGARGSSGGSRRLRDGLVAGEIALTVVLLSGALLFGRSVMRLLSIDPGFRAEHLLTTNVVLPANRYGDPTAQVDAYRRLEERVREIPGVEGVGFVSKLPLDYGNTLSFAIVGQPAPDPSNRPEAFYRPASADYFRTMAIPILSGRGIATTDDRNAASTIVVNRAFAKMYFTDRDAVGQRITNGVDTLTIAGIVRDVPIAKVEEEVPPTMYFPFAQASQSNMFMTVRSSSDAPQLASALRQALASVEASAAMTPPRAMDDLITESPSVFMRRLPLFIVGAFALTALLLAVVGIYGVVSYSVAQRTREMGIRTALGAQPGTLIQLVVNHGLRLAAVGIAVGIGASFFAGRFADRLLYGVHAADPTTYVVVAIALGLVAIAATLLPARRATRVDPAVALRSE